MRPFRKNKFLLWLWLFLALIVRLYKIGLIKCIAVDGVEYINVAKCWIDGRGFHPIWPPLYPWFISLLLRLGIEPELSGQLVSVGFGVLTVAMVYLVAKTLFSPAIAQIATLLCVFHPYLVRYSGEALADSMFTFLVTSCVFCGWLAHRGGQKKRFLFVLLTGLLTGFAYLVKPEGLFLLMIISIWNRRFWHIFCMWAIFLLISFPYLYNMRQQTGHWMISQKEKLVFSVALQDEGYTDEFLDISPLEYAKENPKIFFIKVGKGLLSLFGRFPDAYHPLLFIFLIIGLVTGIKEKRFLFYILTFLIPYFIGYAIFHPGRRYLVGWVPITIFIAADGVQRVGGWLKNNWILVLVTILIMLPKTLESVRDGSTKWKEAGQWIKANSMGSAKIMSEDKRISFYADGQFVPWSEVDFNKVEYVVTEKEIDSLKEAHQVSGGINIYYANR